MKIILFIIFFIFYFPSIVLSENYKFKKIASLDEPWGSSFINYNEIIITEKSLLQNSFKKFFVIKAKIYQKIQFLLNNQEL